MACNDGDRRQWRKQGAIVGAAASKTQAVAKRMLGAATRTRVRGESFRRTDLPRTFLQENARLSRISSQRDTAGRKKSLSVHVSVIECGYTTDRRPALRERAQAEGTDTHNESLAAPAGHAGILGEPPERLRQSGAAGTHHAGDGRVLLPAAAAHCHRGAERGGPRRPAGLCL